MPELAAGAGIRLTKDSLNDLLRISTNVVNGRLLFETYADLAAHTTAPEGTPGEVPTSDAGTHTDPVVGGTVDNSGVFRWSASPAGWERIADVDAISAEGFATSAAASAAAAAASAASRAPHVGLFNIETIAGYAFAMTDAVGNMVFGLTDDGEVQVGSLIAADAAISGTLTGGGAAEGFEGAGNFPADIVGFPAYGQSLSIGTATGAAISTVQAYDNLTFNGGVRSLTEADAAAARASLVPLVESDTAVVSGGAAGETPVSGAADMVKELIATEDGILYTEQSFQLLGFAPGYGGLTLAQLAQGQTPYTRFMADVTSAATLSAAAGKTFKLLAFQWLQSESEIGNTAYDTQLQTLQTNITTDVQAITGQSEEVLLISYEGHASDNVLEIMQAAAADPNIVIAGATYQLARSDGTHFTALSARHFGAYAGRAFKRQIIDGDNWTPLQPLSTFRQGSIAEVKFTVPYGPLVIDTTTYSAQTSYGFRLFQADGTTAMTINSVTITQPDTVRIVASASIPAGAKLRYGFDDPTVHASKFGGNLHDSDPYVFDPAGDALEMFNWCVCFEETL
jgi:hypothetical protein